MTTFQYSINISEESTTIFNGYLKVETNIVTELFQNTDFNTNKLI